LLALSKIRDHMNWIISHTSFSFDRKQDMCANSNPSLQVWILEFAKMTMAVHSFPAALCDAITDIEDHLGVLASWPVWAPRELLLKDHLSVTDRCTLTCFVLGNKLPPLTYARGASWRRARCATPPRTST
jgi:hypothetical protein